MKEQCNLLYLFFAYNRKGILSKCLDTIFSKNELRPDRILISDDGSNRETKEFLYDFQFKSKIPVDIISLGKVIDAGTCIDFAWNFVEYYNPKYLYMIETDYIFRKNGLDQVNDIFENNMYGKQAVGCSGYDDPCFYMKEKTERDFLDIIPREFGEQDNLNRGILYKPFEQETKFGKIWLEFTSNSCSTSYWNFSKMMEIRKEFSQEYERWKFRLFDRHHIIDGSRRCINDAALSSGMSWLWNKYAIKKEINRFEYSAMFNIKPSVAQHMNGGGEHSGGIQSEGFTFCGSPTWRED